MSEMKRFAADVAEELGKDITDHEVIILGTLRMNRLPNEKEGQFWVSYNVRTNGELIFSTVYYPGHSIKCKWTAFLNDLSSPGYWRVVEDTATRKAVAYDDRYIRMTVFQLVTINALCDVPEVE